MKLERSCKNCEFNFKGICVGGGETYKYGEPILDEMKTCDSWSANNQYFCYVMNNAPRFLREVYNDCRINYNEFCFLLDDYCNEKPVKLNFFDAIKMVYGISMIDIAVVLNVTYGVVYRAKTKGFTPKRVKQFATGLCVPEKFLHEIFTSDLCELEQCKIEFFNRPNIMEILDAMPTWKLSLIDEIGTVLDCPMHVAKSVISVDKMFWALEQSKDEYTVSEQRLINYICQSHKELEIVHSIEYSIGMNGFPKVSTKMELTESV